MLPPGPGELKAGLTFFFSPSVFTHNENNKSRRVGCIRDACSFSLQICISIVTQIKRRSVHQNVNERKHTTLVAARSFRQACSPRAFAPGGEAWAACDGSDEDDGRKQCREKATPVNVPLVPVRKLSHTFPKSAVQVKAALNSVSLCGRRASCRSPECRPPRGRKASGKERYLAGPATVLGLAQTLDTELRGGEGVNIVIIL